MWDWISSLAEHRRGGLPIAFVTVTRCVGSTPRELGARMLVLQDGTFEGTIGGGHLEELVIKDALACIEQGEARSLRYPLGARTGQCCGGSVELLIEVLNQGPKLYLFGAGHVAQAVARTLAGTPFSVHVIDERPEWLARLPEGVIAHPEPWDEFVDEARWDATRSFAVVMTHRHDLDQDIIQALLKTPLAYLGLIGSRGKWARFRQRFEARGVREGLERVRCPIGLPLGAGEVGGGKAPQEIAISLAGELLQSHYRTRVAQGAALMPRERDLEAAAEPGPAGELTLQ